MLSLYLKWNSEIVSGFKFSYNFENKYNCTFFSIEEIQIRWQILELDRRLQLVQQIPFSYWPINILRIVWNVKQIWAVLPTILKLVKILKQDFTHFRTQDIAKASNLSFVVILINWK